MEKMEQEPHVGGCEGDASLGFYVHGWKQELIFVLLARLEDRFFHPFMAAVGSLGTKKCGRRRFPCLMSCCRLGRDNVAEQVGRVHV